MSGFFLKRESGAGRRGESCFLFHFSSLTRSSLLDKNITPPPPILNNSQPDRGQALLLLRRLRPPRLRARLRPRRARRRHGHRRRRGRGRPRQRAAAQAVRRHDPDPDFRRGARAVRADRGDHPGVQGRDGGARRGRAVILMCVGEKRVKVEMEN